MSSHPYSKSKINRKLEISPEEFSMPERFLPAWYNHGIRPIDITETSSFQHENKTNNKDLTMAIIINKKGEAIDTNNLTSSQNLRQQFRPIAVVDDIKDDGIKIPHAAGDLEENALKEHMWYDELQNDGKSVQPTNQDVVNLEPLQRFNIKLPENGIVESPAASASPTIDNLSFADKIRNQAKKQDKEKTASSNIAKPGELVIMINGRAEFVGMMKEAIEYIKKAILIDENLTDENIVVFLRVPLDKLFAI